MWAEWEAQPHTEESELFQKNPSCSGIYMPKVMCQSHARHFGERAGHLDAEVPAPTSANVRRRRISSIGTSSSAWGVDATASARSNASRITSNHVGIIE